MNQQNQQFYKPASANAGSLRRALHLLDCLASSPEALGLTELAQASSLDKATTHRLLSVLKECGFVKRDVESRRYCLGLRLAQLGARALEALEVRQVARPHMTSLMRATCQTVHLGILEESQVVYVEKIEGLEPVSLKSRVGGTPPIHATSIGKCLLAFLPLNELERLLPRLTLTPFTANTISDHEAFRRHLEGIRQRGYAVDNEEHREGLRCVGAPVFDLRGDLVAAVSIVGPAFRIPHAEIPQLACRVIECAQAISKDLGYSGRESPGFKSVPDATHTRSTDEGRTS